MMQLRHNVSTIPGKLLINMPTLVVKREDVMVKELELKQGELIIGRDDDCGLPLNDHSISNHHAKIITLFNATYIEDMGSTNGTFVNGKQVREHILHDGDVVTIGKRYRMLFEKSSGESGNKGDKTTVMDRTEMKEALAEFVRADKLQQAAPAPEPAPEQFKPAPEQFKTGTVSDIQSRVADTPDASTPVKACLRVVAGKLNGHEMPLTRRSTRLSRGGITYAKVERTDDGYYLKRDASAPDNSEVLLNGLPLESRSIRLRPEDIINLDGVMMAFQTD